MAVTVVYDFADGVIPAAFDQAPSSPAVTVITVNPAHYSNTPGAFTKAMQLQDLGDSSTAHVSLEVDIDPGGGAVSFWRSVQSEAGSDIGYFDVDGSGGYAVSGGGFSTPSWVFITEPLTAGAHTLNWKFIKDSSTSHGFDNHRVTGITITNVHEVLPDLEGYGYKSAGAQQNRIAFGPHKGPDRGSSRAKYLAWARTQDELVIDDATQRILGLTWESVAEERVDSGVAIQGISTAATALRIEVTRGEDFTVSQSWVHQLEPGQPQLVCFPWVLDEPPEGSWRYRLQLRVDSGTFTIDPGYVSWFIVRRG